MKKAAPCKRCQTDQHLRLMTFNHETYWITCDKCGTHSEPSPNKYATFQNWDHQNIQPSHTENEPSPSKTI